MIEERINEPINRISVIFENGEIKPLSFNWSKRNYKVLKNNMFWIDRNSRPIKYGFSVTVETGEIFQLIYREGDPVWRVDTVILQ